MMLHTQGSVSVLNYSSVPFASLAWVVNSTEISAALGKCFEFQDVWFGMSSWMMPYFNVRTICDSQICFLVLTSDFNHIPDRAILLGRLLE